MNRMKMRILNTIIALTAIAASVNAQTLSVDAIEANIGGEPQMLTVSVSEAATATALQFNLQLPAGLTADISEETGGVTLGDAVDGHTLKVETLESGDLLFVLYSMDLKPFKNGTLLTVPVTAGSEAVTGTAKLSKVRTATGEVSQVYEDKPFDITVTAITGDVNGDGEVGIADIVAVTNVMAGITTSEAVIGRANVNGDSEVGIADIVAITNIMAGK